MRRWRWNRTPKAAGIAKPFAARRRRERAPAVTAIYYLLRAGERSHWHRIDASEIWHWYAGDALELRIGGETVRLGGDLAAGERPQAVVPPREWQAARSFGAWTLVGCTVAPAFEFSGFELAPPDWVPGQ